jgi:hypothetical protein
VWSGNVQTASPIGHGRKGESSIESDGSRSGSILSVPNVSTAFGYPSKGKRNDKGRRLAPSWDRYVTKTFVERREGTGAWQTTRVENRQGPESSKIAVGHRDKHREGNAAASAATRDRGGDYAPHDDEVDSSLKRTTEMLLNNETRRFEQMKRQTNLSVDDEHHRDARQKMAEKMVHVGCKVVPQRPHTGSNDVIASLFQLQAMDSANVRRADETGMRRNGAVEEKQISSSQGAASFMEQQRWSSTRSKRPSTPGEYPDVSSNVKRSNSNVKTKSILTKLSVHYDGQEKILSVPNNGNSVRDRGPQHATKQQRVEARCAPRQQKRAGRPDTS